MHSTTTSRSPAPAATPATMSVTSPGMKKRRVAVSANVSSAATA
jgi:hypothetical protein